jgi:two-component system KDP operon response regulator KdpE
MEGIDLLRDIRQWSPIPVIVLSARGQERHKVEALDAGADDYLTKPFGASELCARLRVALRRASGSAPGDAPFTVGDLKVDLAARRVTVADREVHLTPIEYRLLSALVKNAGKVLTHGHLLAEVWGPGCAFENTYPRVYMSQLRRKIEKDPARPRYLLTESGVGYRLSAE